MPPLGAHSRKVSEALHVRLICKLANILNGLNVTHDHAGDVIEVSQAQGAMLIAEGWGECVSEETEIELSRESDSRDRTG